MKLDQSATKLIIRILILSILLTVLFIVAALLYSVRYWPDLYSYMHPNITITRIPRISQFNVTEFEDDVTTEDITSTFTYEYDLPAIETVFDNDEFDYFDLAKRAGRAVFIDNDNIESSRTNNIVNYSFYIEETTSASILIDANCSSEMTDVEVFAEISEARRIIQNQFVDMKSECREKFRCLSELLKDFIKTYQKFDVIVKETRHHDNQYPETIKTIEVASFHLNNFIKQIIYLFKLQLDGHVPAHGGTDAKDFDYDFLSLNDAKFANNGEIRKINTAIENNKNMIKTKVNNDNSNRKEHGNITKTVAAGGDGGGNDVDDYYDTDTDNNTDYLGIDYIEIYKDTTNEPVTIVTVSNVSDTEGSAEKLNNDTKNLSYDLIEEGVQDNNSTINIQHRCTFNGSHNYLTRSVFPWIATIFIKNGENQQFEYYCDGVLLSERVILTAAQCVVQNDTTVDADDIIVVLGKRSLLLMSEKEKVVKIKKVMIHVEFKKENNEAAENDIAFLVTEDPISFNDMIQPACVMYEDKLDDFIEDNVDIATTGWAFSGELTVIMFDKEKSKDCDSEAKMENIFCANYNNDVTVCPSYGSGFVTRATDNVWYLRGLRTGDPAEKGFCYNTGVFYTDLIDHVERIKYHLHVYL